MMKNSLSIFNFSFPLLTLFFLLITTSCSSDDDDDNNNNDDYIVPAHPLIVNAPFPEGADTLRVLAIGNSFTEDATRYLSALVDSSSIDRERIGVYIVTSPGARFSHWVETISSDASVEAVCKAGTVPMRSCGTMAEVIGQNWDVIVIQQASDVSYKWETFSVLGEYIPMILSLCSNKNVCLAYQMPWSHTPDEMPYVMEWNIKCTRRLTETYGVDVIIPVGTAIQIARETRLNDSMYLTMDKWHLNRGIGRYIASCCWYESIVARCFGTTILNNTACPKGEYSEADIMLGRECAQQAVLHPFKYSED